MIKPIGNRLLIRIEERQQVIKLLNDDKKSNWKFFIEEIGDEVPKKFEIGQELILFEHTHFQGWPDCEKGKNLRIISVADVWGVVQKDKE